MRVLLWLVLFLVVLLGGYRIYIGVWGNPAVIEELRDNPDGERAARAMIVTLQDGRIFPVNYLREADTVYMGIDGLWWRAFREPGAPVSMLIQGEALRGHALAVLDDPEYTADVFERLRPAAPDWLPAWLNGKLVVIQLDG